MSNESVAPRPTEKPDRSAFTCSGIAIVLALIPIVIWNFPGFTCYGSCGGLGFGGVVVVFLALPAIAFLIGIVMAIIGAVRVVNARRQPGGGSTTSSGKSV